MGQTADRRENWLQPHSWDAKFETCTRRRREKKDFGEICGHENLSPEGYCRGLIFKASIRTLECAIVIPLTKDYPKDVLEVVAATNLRDRLHLLDNDEVTVSVFA